MDGKVNPAPTPTPEYWDEATAKRMEGSVETKAISNVPSGATIPKAAIMGKDAEGKPALLKYATVFADTTAAATSIKVTKNSLISAGDVLSDGENVVAVSSINTSNADYDTLTVASGGLGVKKLAGDALFIAKSASELVPSVKPFGFVFADVKKESNNKVDVVIWALNVKINLPDEVKDLMPNFVFNPFFKY